MTAAAKLQTARLTLRPPQDDDAEWIAREIARPEVHQMLTSPPRPYALADAKTWLTSVQKLSGTYVIVADAPIGVISVDSLTWSEELGYWLCRDAWGKGYMTEASVAVAEAWFGASDKDLLSGHLTANAASSNVLRKLGFAYEAPVMRHSGFWGCEVELQRMRLTKTRWLEHGRAAGQTL
jgi:RimJ/RimL family protein N-acetyltransferase